MKQIQRMIGLLALMVAVFIGGSSVAHAQYNPGLVGNLDTLFFGSEQETQEVWHGSFHGGDPVVRTVGGTALSKSSVQLQAYFDSVATDYSMNDAPRLGMEYVVDGTTGITQLVAQPRGTRTATFTLSNLGTGTQVKYRAVVYYADKTAYGEWKTVKTLASGQSPIQSSTTTPQGQLNGLQRLDILLFGTPSAEGSTSQSSTVSTSGTGSTSTSGTQSSSTVVRTSTTNTSSSTSTGAADKGTTIGSSNGLLVGITNDITRAESGDRIVFKVAAANRSSVTASNARITIEIPDGYEFVKTSMGNYDKEDQAILIKLGSLLPGDREEAEFVLRVNASDDDTVTTRATLTANVSGTARTLSATDTDQLIGDGVDNSILGASIFGAGFFPTSLIGWIFIILVIMAMVFIARRYAKNQPKE